MQSNILLPIPLLAIRRNLCYCRPISTRHHVIFQGGKDGRNNTRTENSFRNWKDSRGLISLGPLLRRERPACSGGSPRDTLRADPEHRDRLLQRYGAYLRDVRSVNGRNYGDWTRVGPVCGGRVGGACLQGGQAAHCRVRRGVRRARLSPAARVRPWDAGRTGCFSGEGFAIAAPSTRESREIAARVIAEIEEERRP